jgi:GNAT superfamily N-acetyltransferase
VQQQRAASLWRQAGQGAHIFCAGNPGVDFRQADDGWLMVTGEPIADLNGAFLDAGPGTESLLREYVEVIQGRGLNGFIVLTKAADAALSPSARKLGLVAAGPSPLMAYEPSRLPDLKSVYTVETVKDHAGILVFTDLMARAYGMPLDSVRRFVTGRTLEEHGVMHLIAWRDGEPYSAGTTVQTGSTVGIWNMATPAEKQRQGAGYALLIHALHHHVDQGRGIFYLLASQAGKHLYEQVGFTTIDEGATWLIGG